MTRLMLSVRLAEVMKKSQRQIAVLMVGSEEVVYHSPVA